jgi:hypothetical protein
VLRPLVRIATAPKQVRATTGIVMVHRSAQTHSHQGLVVCRRLPRRMTLRRIWKPVSPQCFLPALDLFEQHHLFVDTKNRVTLQREGGGFVIRRAIGGALAKIDVSPRIGTLCT